MIWSAICVGLLIELPLALDVEIWTDQAEHRTWFVWLDDSSASMNRVGSILGFLLAFRANQGYARWWEARVKWGVVIGKCLRCAQLAGMHINDAARRDRIFKWLIAFPVLLKGGINGANAEP